MGFVDIISEVKFKFAKGTKAFYHVIPREYSDNIIDVKAVKSSTYSSLKVVRLSESPSLSEFEGVSSSNASDLVFFKIELDEQELKDKKVIALEITEIFKKRLEPFPSTISLKEDQYVKFEDSKYFLSVYKVSK
jgi:hypothetical protein